MDLISGNKNRLDIIKKSLTSKGYDENDYILITDEISDKIIKDYTINNFSLVGFYMMRD